MYPFSLPTWVHSHLGIENFQNNVYLYHEVNYSREKRITQGFLFMFIPFLKTGYLTSYRGSKLALLHKVKERKPLSLSD